MGATQELTERVMAGLAACARSRKNELHEVLDSYVNDTLAGNHNERALHLIIDRLYPLIPFPVRLALKKDAVFHLCSANSRTLALALKSAIADGPPMDN